ncbi:MAG TPA: cytochrome D ubiquinol oxidase subunit II, partial [Candidatus Sericytochromatia bacterium]
MASSLSSNPSESLHADVLRLLDRLPNSQHGELIQLVLATIVRMAESDIDRLDWKICAASLQDM